MKRKRKEKKKEAGRGHKPTQDPEMLVLKAKPQPKRGSFTKVEPGDARAISTPKK